MHVIVYSNEPLVRMRLEAYFFSSSSAVRRLRMSAINPR